MMPDKDKQKLFVEGPTDGAVVNKLVKLRLGVDLAEPPSARIVNAPPGDGGFDPALRKFAAALRAKAPARLGLLVDRDNLPGRPDRWPIVKETLLAEGLSVGDQPPPTGVRVELVARRVGVWLMPNNTDAGDLESFLERLILRDRPAVWDYSLTATEKAAELNAPFRPTQAAKARLHTFLAWQDPPGNPYGTAVEAKVLNAQHVAVEPFLDWFQWLFGDGST